MDHKEREPPRFIKYLQRDQMRLISERRIPMQGVLARTIGKIHIVKRFTYWIVIWNHRLIHISFYHVLTNSSITELITNWCLDVWRSTVSAIEMGTSAMLDVAAKTAKMETLRCPLRHRGNAIFLKLKWLIIGDCFDFHIMTVAWIFNPSKQTSCKKLLSSI